MIRGQSPFLGVVYLIGFTIVLSVVLTYEPSVCFEQCKHTIREAPGYAILLGFFLMMIAGGRGIVALQEIERDRHG